MISNQNHWIDRTYLHPVLAVLLACSWLFALLHKKLFNLKCKWDKTNTNIWPLSRFFFFPRFILDQSSLGFRPDRPWTINDWSDGDNGVLGILTRKDLMGFNLEEKIEEWRAKAAGAADLNPDQGGGGGGAGASGYFADAEESQGPLPRVEFTRTHTAVVDILWILLKMVYRFKVYIAICIITQGRSEVRSLLR